MHEIYEPTGLEFRDYVAVCQVSRTLQDGFDRKNRDLICAALAPSMTLDYRSVWPEVPVKTYTPDSFVQECLSAEKLGNRLLSTQHMLGVPYIHSATSDEIAIEWQLIASHGRRGDGDDTSSKIEEQCNARAFLLHKYSKIDGKWKISYIKPTVIYTPGDTAQIFRPE
ncbi:NTF2 [Fusarium phyllophilum]|uniref:NTF2 n=1 Tax=Fusarium phyllophilum TaxID=47803 RepID=A0A8H5I936_9HYPO|nr:NTF2 [Fusarium phyllophilum]